MEGAGVDKRSLDVNVENDVLRVEGRIDYSKYEGMDPLYTEFNVGHFARSFTLSNKIDQQQISAQLEDGVLTLTLKGQGGHAAADRDQLIEDRRSKRGRNSAARSMLTI